MAVREWAGFSKIFFAMRFGTWMPSDRDQRISEAPGGLNLGGCRHDQRFRRSDPAVILGCTGVKERALDLPPWQRPPCDITDIEGSLEDNGLGGYRAAALLLQRMQRCGVSKWHPDHIAACEAAEAKAAPLMKKSAREGEGRKPARGLK